MIYYRRFWALQFDQFTHWMHGFVAEDIFVYWMRERHDNWISNPQFANITYREGWENAMKAWTYTEVIEFMKIVHERTVEEALRDYGPQKHRFLGVFRRKRLR